jgi:hypothetical protein
VVKCYVKVFHLIIPSGKISRLPVNLSLITLLLLLPLRSLTAQDNNLYLMPEIPQANQLNPAIFKLCRIYVELPVISSVRLNIRNSAFGFHDVVQRGTGAQSNTWLVNTTKFDRILKGVNYSQIETDIDLLGLGFGYKEWYFTFGIANHSDILLSYPHDVVLLRDDRLQTAGTSGTQINLFHTGVEMTLWNSIGISAAREISDGLKLGLRVKYLQGMANAISRPSDLSLNYAVNPSTLDVLINARLNSSFPVQVGSAPNGAVNGLNFDNSLNNFIGNYIFNGNRGVSIDAGFVYDVDEKTQFSGSITDLGFIHLRKNTNSFTINRNSIFNAADLASLQTKPSRVDLLNALNDSISGAVRNLPKSYYTLTPIKIFGGITRLLLPNLRAGAMTRIEIYNLHVLPSFSLSMNYTPVPPVSASLSYTLMNNKFNQIGAGIALGNRIVQFYMITDNIVFRFTKDINSSYSWPYNARMLSLRFGLNLLFGCKEKESKFHSKSRKDSCPAYW